MGRQISVKRVFKYGLSATDALQWSSRSKKIMVTMKSCGCLILLSQNFLLSYDIDDENVEFIY